MQIDAFIAECKKELPQAKLLTNEPMSRHTTFKIGGAADVFIMPTSMAEISCVLKLINKYNLPLTVVGNGSNMLVLDKGIRGVVLNFADNMSGIRAEENHIIASAGALLKDVADFAAEKSLAGLEFACGIPGSIGGAVFMNAGAYGGEMKNVVDIVRTIDSLGNLKTYTRDELKLGYRHSIFQENGEIICEVELVLAAGNKEEIKNKITDYTARRESKQPLEMPSAGSTFKRPEGYFAGTLIEQTGLKGLTVGGAQVSTKHAGFVVNIGSATAADVINLIHEVQRRVKAKHGVDLQPEVRLIGEK